MTIIEILYNSEHSVLWDIPPQNKIEEVVKDLLKTDLLVDESVIAFTASGIKRYTKEEETLILKTFIDSSRNTPAHTYKEFAGKLLESVRVALEMCDQKKKFKLHLRLSTGNNTISISL